MRSTTVFTLALAALSVSAHDEQKDNTAPQYTTDNPNPACLDNYNTCIASTMPRAQCTCLQQACEHGVPEGKDNCPYTNTAYNPSAAGPPKSQATSAPANNNNNPQNDAPTNTGAPLITGTLGPAPGGGSPTAAPAGSIPLGDVCSDDRQCAGEGVSCYGQTSGTIPSCGSFNAPCQRDDQCATNTCNQKTHICSGFLPSQSWLAHQPAVTSAAAAGAMRGHGGSQGMDTMTKVTPSMSGNLGPEYIPTSYPGGQNGTMTAPGGSRATGGAGGGMRGNATTSGRPAVSTGGASTVGVFSGVAAVGFGILAWVV